MVVGVELDIDDGGVAALRRVRWGWWKGGLMRGVRWRGWGGWRKEGGEDMELCFERLWQVAVSAEASLGDCVY